MSRYRQSLPQLSEDLFMTDGGMETTLVFHHNINLPYFASFDVLKTEEGRKTINQYYDKYISIATQNGTGFILETPTWRANSDWGAKMNLSFEELDMVNLDSVKMLMEMRRQRETSATPMVVSGCLGPRGDGYKPAFAMTPEEAEDYHRRQLDTFRQSGVDMASAMTISYVEEAIGIALAAKSLGLPISISFTVETDGRLPNGQSLKEAITKVDAATNNYPVYYMINCAHPTHFIPSLQKGDPWVERIKAVRANSSRKSHAELDESETLDEGNPEELGSQYKELLQVFPHINVLGGCCGTDHRHVESICKSCIRK